MNRIEYLKSLHDLITPDACAYREILEREYYARREGREIDRKAHFLTAFAKEIPIVIDEKELLIGSMRFSKKFENLNKGHVIVDYAALLSGGIPRLSDRLAMLDSPDSRAFKQALDAFVIYLSRHAAAAKELGMNDAAAVLDALTRRAPSGFYEGLMLVWLTHLFLHAEGSASGFSFGRFDKYLYPFYETDISSGKITREFAKELLSAFFIKCCEADESQALTVGGDVENELTFLILEVCRELGVKQPSVEVRTSKKSSDRLWQATADGIKAGYGNPAVFNDETIVRALEENGIERADAENYAIVGCYEATPDACAFGTTSSAAFFYLRDILTEFLDKTADYANFDSLLSAFLDFFRKKYNTDILEYIREDRWISRVRGECPSPFESLLLGGCLDSGICAEHGGAKYTLAGINILGIGTLTDSLFAIKKLVYERDECTLSYLKEQLKDNFPDGDLFLKCRRLPGKYGTANPESDALARRLSEHIREVVSAGEIFDGVTPSPGLFVFLHDVDSKSYPATPDGRRAGERTSYGIAPSEIAEGKTHTTLLRSAAAIPQHLFPNGTPLQLRLSKSDLEGENGNARITALIKGYFCLGGSHIQINVQDTATLLDARAHPENYPDLLVRISGYSDRFVRLREDIKDALIEREI